MALLLAFQEWRFRRFQSILLHFEGLSTPQEVRAFAALLRSEQQSFFGQALIHGNVSLELAKGLVQTLDALPFRGALTGGVAGGLLRSRFAMLEGDVLQVQPEPNVEETNHAPLGKRQRLKPLNEVGLRVLDGGRGHRRP